ncbi:hypothetical protein MIMGU_mgv1a022927mg [Erythranthe guttata]|uniref:non-specific serine/threonine protein kinase n=1 Tax=Erythranthe guttata TaxID=4155 RepID=A0A022RLP8_ERYGU|nr:hypothetical protein MIMGU_mgv1a022927mg [Erythranthe guttata]
MEKTCYYILACTSVLLQMSCYCVAVKNSTTLATDQFSLFVLKSHVNLDPYGIITSNWTNSSSVCSWIGVTCDLRNHRVTALNISHMSLSGTIPPQIENLSFLVSLDLSSNLFSGVIPQQLSLLHRLKFISLQNNSFTGFIPSSLSNLTNLRVVDFSSNFLQGNIPHLLGRLHNLHTLYMDYNHLSGHIPSSVFNLKLPLLQEIDLYLNKLSGELPSNLSECSQLRFVSLSYNLFSGQIPIEIGKLKFMRMLYLGGNNLKGGLPREIGKIYQLKVLQLYYNSFTGFIPLELFNMSNLIDIDLSGNSLSGGLPTNLGHGLPVLETLFLHTNYLTGTIPNSITNCSKLRYLELALNELTGFVPHFLGNLRHLEYITLAVNNLRTESTSSELSFITSLTNCRSLRVLAIGDNPLGGILPASIGNLSTSLQHLYAHNCEIKGIIPTEIGNLSNLMALSLHINELSGNIPLTFNYLQKLQGLYLHNNNVSGSIPEGLCDLHSLVDLYLSQNKFSGPILECLGNITSLRKLFLDSNMLTSTIPSSMWRLTDLMYLDLSSNSLIGFLPPEIGNLVKTIRINLSMNRFSESIPNTIGNLISLNALSLAHNLLEGSIPDSVGRMISLVSIDFSYNSLFGSIPKSLEALQYLDYLNVSFNALRGEIPTGGPFLNFTIDSFKGNDALCGIPRFNVPLCNHNVSKHRSMMKKVRLALFIASGVVALISLLSLAFVFVRYRRKHKAINVIDGLVPTISERISYYELLQTTDYFSETNLIGMGSFGSVYKAVRRDGKIFAVKVFNSLSEASSKSFGVECEVLRNIRHRNLTKVISSCSNEDFKALVLEYMPNGNLDKWLYSHNYCLDLIQRLNIMIDVACALEYLHHGYSILIVHCDLKPSNVLLDEEMVAHVSDFGIAKLMGEGESIVHTNTLATIGYIAPEYGLGGLVSTRCDVYSYGVMVMETFTRKRPSDDMFNGDLTLKNWVQSSLNNESSSEVIDANLLNSENEQDFEKNVQCVSSILDLSLKCCAESSGDRINMKEVITELQKIKGRFSRRD